MKAKDKPKPGPEPERVKIRGAWNKAVAEALKKPPMPKSPRKRRK